MTLLTNPSLPANTFLAISLHGSGVELGTVSAGAVCRYAEALRLGLQGAVEIVESAKLVATPGRRKRWIEQMTDLPLLGIEPGELRILFGEPKQAGLFADSDRESLVKAVDLLFQGLAVYAAGIFGVDDGSVSDTPLEASPKLLGIVSRLMPPRRGSIKRITVWRQAEESAGNFAVAITLDRASRDRITAEIDKQMVPLTDNHVGKKMQSQNGEETFDLLTSTDDR